MNVDTLDALRAWRGELQDEAWIEDCVNHAQLCQGTVDGPSDRFDRLRAHLSRHSYRSLRF
jgi:hypothetical protein